MEAALRTTGACQTCSDKPTTATRMSLLAPSGLAHTQRGRARVVRAAADDLRNVARLMFLGVV